VLNTRDEECVSLDAIAIAEDTQAHSVFIEEYLRECMENFNGQPLAVILVTILTLKKFCDMDA
jgi:hypothetical protein